MRAGSNLASVCQRSLGKKNLFGLKKINFSVPKKPIKCNSHFWDLLWFPCENGSQEGEQRMVKLILLLCLAVLCQQLSCLTAKRSFENTGCPRPLGQLVTSFLLIPFVLQFGTNP